MASEHELQASATTEPGGTDQVGSAEGLALADLADRYRMLVEHSPDAICVHQNGVIVYINPSGLRHLRAEVADQLLGHAITEFIDPGSIGPMMARIAALTRHGAASAPSEASILRVDGTVLPMEAVSVRTSWNGEPAFQVILRDLTEHRAAQDALRHQAALVTHVSDAIIGVDADATVTSWNPAAESVYGRSAADAIGQPVSTALGVGFDPAATLAAGGRIRDTHIKADGTALAVMVSAARMDSGFVLVCADQTAVRRAEQHFTTVVESLDEGVVVLDSDGRITSANLAAKRILDIQTGSLVEGSPNELPFRAYDTEDRPFRVGEHPVARARSTGEPSTAIVGIERRRDGRRFWLSLTAILLDPGSAGLSVLTSFSDVTERHHAGKRLEYVATHDELTGLSNRTLLIARLDEELSRESRRTALTVLFIDLDNFKAINDTHGHSIGDTVLRAVADRLLGVLRTDAVVGRIGGDEFVAVIPGELDGCVDRIRDALSSSMTVEDRTFDVAASIGKVVVPPGDLRSAEDVLSDADLEMYQAKASPRRSARSNFTRT